MTSINGAYADGVSLTHGSPRRHIWTFVAGASEGNPEADYVCPCDSRVNIRRPSFVGSAYFCESGINRAWDPNRHYYLHNGDVLWDGQNCLSGSSCCGLHHPPYFVRNLPTATADSLEARICNYFASGTADTAVQLVELYVK